MILLLSPALLRFRQSTFCPTPAQVAVYSPADRLQPHRYKADEAYQVGNADMQPVACYLDIDSEWQQGVHSTCKHDLESGRVL